MRKILIMPYFGIFPSYFDLWLHSCGMNKNIDFLVVTDNPEPADLPKNVKWIQTGFAELSRSFQDKMGFRIWLKNPYKLCDYKGFYGYLFSDYLRGYDFWGYCDCDVIFGSIEDFLTEELFEKYDKLLRTGHLSFIRNTPEINENFFRYNTYKRVMTSPVIYGYDEAVDGYRKGFAGELLDQGFRFYQNDAMPADIDFRHFPMRVVTDPKDCCVFHYHDGMLFRAYQMNGQLCQQQVIYVHLQKRKMVVEADVRKNEFLIRPNTFTRWQPAWLSDRAFWDEVSEEREDYFDFKQEQKNERIRDLHRLLYEPSKLACLRYRMKSKGKNA